MTSKLIRMGVMGPPMSYKTGFVVGTFPRPLLYLGGDPHGLSIVPAVKVSNLQSPFKMEVCQSDIQPVKSEELQAMCAKETKDLPPITYINFYQGGQMLNDTYNPTPDAVNFPAFNKMGNMLIQRCPWRTVVVDPITAFSDIILGHLATVQPGQLLDARKWAPSVAMKVKQTIASFNRLSAHTVFIMHSEQPEKDEITSKVEILPVVFSKFKNIISGLFAQFVFAEIKNGKPIVYTQPTAYCKVIGMRWPLNLPVECEASFEALFGGAVKSGEVEK